MGIHELKEWLQSKGADLEHAHPVEKGDLVAMAQALSKPSE